MERPVAAAENHGLRACEPVSVRSEMHAVAAAIAAATTAADGFLCLEPVANFISPLSLRV